MKALRIIGAATIALLAAGCGNDGGGGNASAAAGSTPIEAIPAPNGSDWTQVVAATPEGGFVMGNPNAPVKFVEYASLTCPHCRDFSATAMEPLKNTYVKSGQVSYEFRNFVLNSIDLAATVLARCQGATPYFGLTEQIYAQQDQWVAKFQAIAPAEQQRIQSLPQDRQLAALAEAGDLPSFFRMRGLPAARAEACLADRKAIEDVVQMGQTATEKYNVTGTPNFLINDKLVEGAGTWEQLEPKIREAIG